MKVRVTDDAKSDLQQIETFIDQRNSIAAEGVIDRIRKTITLLAVLPRLGHPGLVPRTLEKGVPRVPYLVVYRIDAAKDDHELVVLRVYHHAQPRSQYDPL